MRRRDEVIPPYGVAGCGIKTEVRALGFYGFAKQNLFYACAKRTKKGTPEGVPFAHTPCALSPPKLAFGKEGGQAHRSAPHKIPRKSQGVYLTFTPLPAPQRRGLVRRADERGVSQKVSSELFEYLGGTQSPLYSQGESEAFPFSLPCIYPILSISGYIPRPRKTTPSNRKLRC